MVFVPAMVAGARAGMERAERRTCAINDTFEQDHQRELAHTMCNLLLKIDLGLPPEVWFFSFPFIMCSMMLGIFLERFSDLFVIAGMLLIPTLLVLLLLWLGKKFYVNPAQKKLQLAVDQDPNGSEIIAKVRHILSTS